VSTAKLLIVRVFASMLAQVCIGDWVWNGCHANICNGIADLLSACFVIMPPCHKLGILQLSEASYFCRWEKQGKVYHGGPKGSFDGGGAGAHCIVRDLDTRDFYMFYEAFDDSGRRSIGLASSPDGLREWDRHPEPVLQASDNADAWDAGEVGAPYAVSMAAGKWRLYYAGKQRDQSAWSGFGVALSVEQQGALALPTKFRRRVR
jgi:hypothetical protein